jgi:hypothetical protein
MMTLDSISQKNTQKSTSGTTPLAETIYVALIKNGFKELFYPFGVLQQTRITLARFQGIILIKESSPLEKEVEGAHETLTALEQADS